MENEEKTLEKLIIFSLEVAQNMLDEYELVIPFGVHALANSEDIKMRCFQEKQPTADWGELIQTTTNELKKTIAQEKIVATAIVLSVEADDQKGIGVQIETPQSPVLFVYPYHKEEDKWVIDEPTQAQMLIAPKVFN